MKYFIGIDIGTSTICGILYNLSNNEIKVTTRKNDATIVSSLYWEKIQDPEKIFGIVKDILDTFLTDYPGVLGIGFTGQMHGILYVDKNGKNLSHLISWQDGRGNLFYKNNLNYASFINNETGYKVSSGFGLVTHYFNIKNNLVPEGSRKICTIMDYVIMRLVKKNNPVIDTTNAASLGFFDLENLKFDLKAIQSSFIDPDILPEISEASKSTGYYNGIPVFPAIGDNQAAFLGSVNSLGNSVLVNIGTSGQISIYSENYLQSELLDIRPFPGGGYIIVGAALCGGNSLTLLKDFFEKCNNLFCKEPIIQNDFYEIANSINLNQYSDGLKVETLFEGSRINPGRRGVIKNITINNFTPQELIIGFYRGIIDELYGFYNQLPDELKQNKLNIIGSGNAIRKNSLLCKILEEYSGSIVLIPKYNEEAAFGACISAMTGNGNIDAFRNAGKLVEYLPYQKM